LIFETIPDNSKKERRNRMPMRTNKELLTLAKKGNYAVGAFNMNNLEILQAIVSAGEAEKSPAIIAVSEGAI
jgi:fructose-bisphosphate aldolase class II